MSAPEQIWTYNHVGCDGIRGEWRPIDMSQMYGPMTEYRRADLPPTDAEVLAHPKVKALVEAANDICLIAERDEWHKAMTGRQIILRNLRAALAAIQEAKP